MFLHFYNPIKKNIDFTLKLLLFLNLKKIGFWKMHNNKIKSIRILVLSA